MSTAKRKKHVTDQPSAPPPEGRLTVPDPNDPAVIARLKASLAALDPDDEADAIRWIEAVSMFDNEDSKHE
ncbi:hypothetical protein NOJ28_12440 [Neorhizobium galegae]|uniref:hypothetical protein n=1 Tax=Neorhizobium galegae TaxID=399 RepID=UPI000621F549|nr:hypothetical protein [Neorhizobium galegae]MCQ1766343.1 hypothetical protein [Neorhizobium galegae]MCQ1845257.1 hypothetical protein [Neorhizobium galegae]CDZ36538.1 Hypothetical protein NGAL_HAMBI1146_19330 [Neorhizobium galegae bv. officinalis]